MHEIVHLIFDENTDKAKILKEASDIADRNGDSTGQIGRINFIDNKICKDEKDARAYLDEIDNGWYDQLAVRFLSYSSESLENARTKKLKSQISALQSKIYETDRELYPKTIKKTEFIGCKECGSKLAVKFLNRNYCPVCAHDLRPKGTLAKIETLKSKLNQLQMILNAEEDDLKERNKKKAKIKWLVKIEYHC